MTPLTGSGRRPDIRPHLPKDFGDGAAPARYIPAAAYMTLGGEGNSSAPRAASRSITPATWAAHRPRAGPARVVQRPDSNRARPTARFAPFRRATVFILHARAADERAREAHRRLLSD